MSSEAVRGVLSRPHNAPDVRADYAALESTGASKAAVREIIRPTAVRLGYDVRLHRPFGPQWFQDVSRGW